jgi:hypothetical protein
MWEKFKHVLENDSLFYGSLLVIVSIASFGLGRLSLQDLRIAGEQKASVQLFDQRRAVEDLQKENQIEDLQDEDATYVGSKNGSKYHFPWCVGAKQIKEENKIFFATKDEAEKAGYAPASNCKGL